MFRDLAVSTLLPQAAQTQVSFLCKSDFSLIFYHHRLRFRVLSQIIDQVYYDVLINY